MELAESTSSPPRPLTVNWTLESLVSLSSNFVKVKRVSATLPENELAEILSHHEYKGLPLVLEGCNSIPGWNSEGLTPDFLAAKYPDPIPIRNVHSRTDVDMPLTELLEIYRNSAEHSYPGEVERYYGKDVPCPPEWDEQLKLLPGSLLPLQDGDTFAYMRPEDRPETKMCYFGIGDTYTPAHKDSSASTGQNLMIHASAVSGASSPIDRRVQEILGSSDASSFWFMTSSEDSAAASQFFLHTLGHDLDHEHHLAGIDELKKAEFQIYLCEQKVGDLVVIPRMSCHQVVNHGGTSLKVAWSRMPLSSMEAALKYELPIYRRVGRQEIYRVKLLIHQTVQKLADNFKTLSSNEMHHFRRLYRFINEIHAEEYHPSYEDFLAESDDLRISCDCCGCDIFQSYFECSSCVLADSSESTYTMCPTCYVEGRTCLCGAMVPRTATSWNKYLLIRNTAAGLLGEKSCDLVDYEHSSHLAVFRAAVLLHRQRESASNNPKPSRRCSPTNRSLVHTISTDVAVPCPSCHRTLCYQHVLAAQRVHSAEILLFNEKHTERGAWHEFHTGLKERWRVAHAPGSEVIDDLRYRLVRAVSSHTTLRPVNPKTRVGWYDDGFISFDEAIVSSKDISGTNPPTPIKPPPTSATKKTPSTTNSGRKRRLTDALDGNNDGVGEVSKTPRTPTVGALGDTSSTSDALRAAKRSRTKQTIKPLTSPKKLAPADHWTPINVDVHQNVQENNLDELDLISPMTHTPNKTPLRQPKAHPSSRVRSSPDATSDTSRDERSRLLKELDDVKSRATENENRLVKHHSEILSARDAHIRLLERENASLKERASKSEEYVSILLSKIGPISIVPAGDQKSPFNGSGSTSGGQSSAPRSSDAWPARLNMSTRTTSYNRDGSDNGMQLQITPSNLPSTIGSAGGGRPSAIATSAESSMQRLTTPPVDSAYWVPSQNARPTASQPVHHPVTSSISYATQSFTPAPYTHGSQNGHSDRSTPTQNGPSQRSSQNGSGELDTKSWR